jgi:outer membrane protein OmpA-like peptidoglycan-associated protein
MRARLRLMLAVLATLAVSQASAEPVGSYFYVAPVGGFTIFDGNLRFPTDIPIRDQYYLGLRAGYQMRSWLGLEGAGGITPTREDYEGGPDVRFVHGSLDLVISPFQGRAGGPFLLVGGGAAKLTTNDAALLPAGTETEIQQGNLELGGGLRFWLTDAFGLRVEGRDMLWVRKDAPDDDERHHTIVLGGGLVYAIGATPRDTDADGVPDRKDQCPGTPAGARVDDKGCPIDSDGDAVFDGLDQCPDTPKGATVDAKGCPSDADADGVFDGIDTCADTPKGATVDAKGCPSDTDADSVYDGIDQCPNTPAGASVDAKGCPNDADNDGVPDGLDKCPGTAIGLKVDKDGCPIEVIERETEMLDTGMIRIQNVNFETAKADLLPESFPSLDIVGQVLTKWPDLRIEIGGHTDSRGSNAYNQKLSEARVRSVLAYLLQKFPALKAEQYTVKGYGESTPLVPNNSDLNMAKNRRVEFKVLNTEVLKREIERRRLLKQ